MPVFTYAREGIVLDDPTRIFEKSPWYCPRVERRWLRSSWLRNVPAAVNRNEGRRLMAPSLKEQ